MFSAAKNRQVILAVILSALVVGLIYIYPDSRFIMSLGGDYKGIAMTATNDELGYLGQINAFYKGGNWRLSGFDTFEHLGEPWTFGFLPPFLLGALGKLVSLGVIRLDLLLSFMLPAILFMLIFILAYKLCKSPALSLLSSFSVLLGYYFFSGKPSVLAQLITFKYSEPLWFLRPISPQFNHIPLILSLIFIYMAIGERRRWAIWAAGITIGSLFYIFVYYWTFIYAGLFVLLLIFLVNKDLVRVREIFFIGLISAVISLPYWFNFWQLMHLKNYADLEYFNNILYTRKPILPISQLVLIFIIIATFYRKEKGFAFLYIAAFLAGGLLCVNQQIITGKVLFAGHWIGYSNKTFIIIAFVSSLANLKENIAWQKCRERLPVLKNAAAVVIVILIVYAIIQQGNYYEKNRAYYSKKQSLAVLYSWLGKNTKMNDVILIDPFTRLEDDPLASEDLLVYTHDLSFLPVSIGTVRSRAELEARYVVALNLLNYNASDAKGFFEYGNGIYIRMMRALEEYGGGAIDPKYVADLVARFEASKRGGAFTRELKNFKLNYLIIDRKHLKRYGMFKDAFEKKPVFEDGDRVVFKVRDIQ